MPEPEAQTPIPQPRPSFVARSQERLARVFGVTPAERGTTVERMLARGRQVPAGYWLQLVLAMGIATLGLLLGSTAVVIGAMLVSPLMGPIVELGMGLAIGSPLLVVRTALRLVLSVLIVVLSAAVLTLAVPIHQVTSEIAARTTPNLLDLAIASFCAIAAVYATIRSDPEVTSTAAGTAIGIALVPPLCVVGFGIGTGSGSIAGGAGLLFTANFCAILFLSVVAFIVLGYARVDVARLERAQRAADEPGFVRRAAQRLSVFFSSKLGPATRVAMPLLFLAGVFIPLRSALREVTWEIQARSATQEALRDLQGDTIDVSVRVEQHRVYIRLITVNDGASVELLRARLVERVRAKAGVIPNVEIVAVPDAEALARAQAALRDRAPTESSPAIAAASERPFERMRRDVEAGLSSWPADSVGPLAGWSLTLAPNAALRVEVLHVGRELARPATDRLAADLASHLGTELIVDDVALSAEPIAGELARGRAYRVAAMLRRFPGAANVRACITVPPHGVSDLEASTDDPRVIVREGGTWVLRWSSTDCLDAADSGAPDARAREREAGTDTDHDDAGRPAP